MNNDGFQLEELENAAVKKSNNAKRAAAIGATVVGSGAIGVAGKTVYDNSATNGIQNDVEEPLLSDEDIEGVAKTGAGQVDSSQPAQEETVSTTSKSSTAPAPAQPKVSTSQTDDEIDLSFEKTTHYYGDDNELIMTTEEGKVEGHDFLLADVDGDMQADILAYDANSNGSYEENEIVALEGRNQIAMGNPTSQHDDVFLAMQEPEPYPVDPIDEPYYDLNEEKGYAENDDDIHNDFEDEKTGEVYRDDYAENNENYNNNGDVEHYGASTDLAYEEDDIVNDDYEEDFDALASNEATGDDVDDIANDDFIDIA